jgi:hypothetical protein
MNTHSLAGRVSVASANGQYGLFALDTIEEGERVLRIEGERTVRPTRYSVQIDENVHLDLSEGCSLGDMTTRYAWRFLNHHCDPNTVIRDREVFALRRIAPLEEITFNYNTTEYEMAEPFVCHCSSCGCLGSIRGFKHLTTAERDRLRPWLAPYLLRILESQPPLPAASETVSANVTP